MDESRNPPMKDHDADVGRPPGRSASHEVQGYELAPEADSSQASVGARPGPTHAEPVAASAPAIDLSTPFVQGFGGIRFTAGVFGVLSVVALVIVGVRAGSLGMPQVLVHLGATVLEIAAMGAVGTLAAIAAARCVGTRVAEPELFALRMLSASAAFELLYATGTPIPTRIDDTIIGLAGYVTVVWLLFRLSPRQTGLVVAWHAGLIALTWAAAWTATLRKPPIRPASAEPVEAGPQGAEMAPPPHAPE